MVVTVSEPATIVGRDLLRKGGTAIDAAVGVGFALAVTWPEAGNIGGGGFCLVKPPGENPVLFDYRETAPASTHRETYRNLKSALNHQSVGTPGTVRGLHLAHQRFGKLPWKDVVLPAVTLAEDGVDVSSALASSLNGVLAKSKEFAELQRVYGKPDGQPWKAGDRLVQPELAKTLRQIAEHGPDGFYTGKVAQQIVDEMQAGQGYVSLEDLKTYEAKVRVPHYGTYRWYDVYSTPAPAGGVVLVEMLNILENFDLKAQDRWSPKTVHLLAEAARRAYADRARHLGDPDFTPFPAHLNSKAYATDLARAIDVSGATPSEAVAPDIPLTESESTTHFSVIDEAGMAVANTYTLEASFGSRVVVRGAGFLLNNEMGDFNWRPGVTTRSGPIGTEPNVVAPGKRMLSSQTPTIVVKDGKPVLITGSPGGRTIINTVLCVVLNRLEFGMDLESAVDAPRQHHQWFPDRITLEAAAMKEHPELAAALKAMGHTLGEPSPHQGDAHSIAIDPATGEYHGVADRRRQGTAAAP